MGESAEVAAIDPEKVLYTWPDGGLAYDCRGCGACCRGLGIGVDASSGELDALCEHSPGVAAFARLRGATWTVFNPRDRCWFLDDEGFCTIERERGREAKPASCRLFPFNRVFRLGSWTVIDVNSVICPLGPVSKEGLDAPVAMGGPVRHADVLKDVSAVQDKAVVGTLLGAQDSESEGRALVTRETDIAARCFALSEACVGADGAALEGIVERAVKGQEAEAAKQAVPAPTVEGVRVGVAAIFEDAELETPSAETVRIALLATPSLRFNELYGRRVYVGGRDDLLGVLPVMWRGWLHFLALGEELARRPLSLQEVTTTWNEVAGLIYLLALWQTPVHGTSDTVSLPDGPLRGPLEQCARACRVNKEGKAFGELVAPLVALSLARERVAALRAAEDLPPTMGLGPLVVALPKRAERSLSKRRARR